MKTEILFDEVKTRFLATIKKRQSSSWKPDRETSTDEICCYLATKQYVVNDVVNEVVLLDYPDPFLCVVWFFVCCQIVVSIVKMNTRGQKHLIQRRFVRLLEFCYFNIHSNESLNSFVPYNTFVTNSDVQI